MKSLSLLSLILSLSVACTSTSETDVEGQKPEVDAASAQSADVKSEAENPAGGEANAVAASADEKLASVVADAAAAPDEAGSAEAPSAEALAAEALAAEAPAAEQTAPKEDASGEKIVYPTASLVNLRQGPGKSHAVARLAKFGESISLTGEKKNSWLKTTDGLWISSLFVSESKSERANDPAVEAPAPAKEDPATAEQNTGDQTPVDAAASEQSAAQ